MYSTCEQDQANQQGAEHDQSITTVIVTLISAQGARQWALEVNPECCTRLTVAIAQSAPSNSRDTVASDLIPPPANSIPASRKNAVRANLPISNPPLQGPHKFTRSGLTARCSVGN